MRRRKNSKYPSRSKTQNTQVGQVGALHTNTYNPLPAQSCKTCNTKCDYGWYIYNWCITNGDTDIDCRACERDCNHTEGLKTPCDGTQLDLSPLERQCVWCDSCGEGSFITNGCPTYVPNKNNCTTCTSSCNGGKYMSSNCTGTKMYDDSQCTLCATCAVGEYISSQCPAGISFSDTRTCAPCSDCSTFSDTLMQGQAALVLTPIVALDLSVLNLT
jgi:hypothetical protein